MPQSTPELRRLWKDYECAAAKMQRIAFGPDTILVAPQTVDAWRALAAIFAAHGYMIRTSDTDSYNCRRITGGAGKSLHSYGIALDINWSTNPYIDHAGERAVRFSTKPTQAARALDVKHALADTDMTPAMIKDALSIRTYAGKPVFEWGGNWQSVKDCMHFEIDVAPDDLEGGIDWSTVAADPIAPVDISTLYRVIAREGLRLREGPGLDFPSRRTLGAGTIVHILSVKDDWAQVDLERDGLADGYMFHAFLEPVG